MISGFAGRIAAGAVRVGDMVKALPSGRESGVRSTVTWDGNLAIAEAGSSVTLSLEDEVDISRGDMLVSPSHPPNWVCFVRNVGLDECESIALRRPYLLKHAAQTVRARVEGEIEKVDVQTLETEPAGTLRLNEIGRAIISADRDLAFDLYRDSRATGAFILIDMITNETVAAGMISGAAERSGASGEVQPAEREAHNGHRAAVIIARDAEHAVALERALFERGIFAVSVKEQTASAVMSLYRAGAVGDCLEPAGKNIRKYAFD